MGKERYQETKSGYIGEDTKESLKKWGKRLGLIAVALIGLAWIL